MEHIAIVGVGCLFPGADSPEKYWDNLLREKDCSTPLSALELGVDPACYYSPVAGTPDTINYVNNGHVRDFHFDGKGYNLPEEELNTLDNLFKWTIYAAAQALNDSGYRQHKNILEKTGLILGNIGMPTHSTKHIMSPFYHKILQPYIQKLIGRPDFQFDQCWPQANHSDQNLMTGGHNATIAALALGLSGPRYCLDAACASALYAIKSGVDYLLSHKADMMLVGSVCHVDHIYIDHGFNMLQVFPDKGDSIPFDKASRGVKAGEGAGVVAIKRYADAVRDNDKIYGVIESIGLSNDAGTKHLLVPDQKGQSIALERAYQNIPRDIDYIECHATGTNLGDQVELSTIETFFGEPASDEQVSASKGKIPLIGANKAINGHMLTASGMGSLLKVLLAMKHSLIPGTPRVNQLVSTPKGQLNIENIVREARPWPASHRAKRAGISAFGFGGVNGHMVISEDTPALRAACAQIRPDSPQKADPLVIVGIGVHMAKTEDSKTLDQTLQQGTQHFYPLPKTRWIGIEKRPDVLAMRGVSHPSLGSYIESFEFDCKKFKLPPNVVSTHLSFPLFLLPIAEQAFLNAGYSLDGKKRNIAVIVTGGIDYSSLRYQARNEISWQLRQSLLSHGIHLSEEDVVALQEIVKDSLFPKPYLEGITGGIGNIVASRVAAHLKLNGPAFTLYGEESSPFKALELAQFMLARQQVDAVMIASRSFGGSLENVLWDHQSYQCNQIVGDGGGAIVLKREQDAIRDDTPIYAVLDGMGIGYMPDNTLDCRQAKTAAIEKTIVSAAKAGLAAAQCSADQIGYIELYAGGKPGEIAAELAALSRVYGSSGGKPTAAIGTLKANYGHLFATAGLLSIIKSALQLSQRYLPALPDYPQRQELAHHAGDKFHLPARTEAWPVPAKAPRRAVVSHLSIDRSYNHVILSEPQQGKRARPTDRQESSQSGLNVRVYTAREKTVEEFILNEQTLARFAPLSEAGPYQAAAAAPVNSANTPPSMEISQFIRNATTQLHYLQLEQTYYQLINQHLADVHPVNVHPIEVHPVKVHPANMPVVPEKNAAASPVIFDEQQLLELTDGSVAKVLGAEYAEVDSYPIRTRMPSLPFMFVSRITALSATKDKLEPCHIEWEYDIPEDAWYAVNGYIPSFVALESSHAMIVAFTVIGCDMLFKGQLCYRAVDCSTTMYSEMPRTGEILRGQVNITSIRRVGGLVLATYEYLCYVGERLVFRLTATSGFFSRKGIEKAGNFDTSPYFAKARALLSHNGPSHHDLMRNTNALMNNVILPCERTTFTEQDITRAMNGDLAACFGSHYGRISGKHLCTPDTRMLSRILSIDTAGGALGLGQAVGELDIDPDHWAFKAHFKNDPVMPGTLLVEGAEQLMKFYLFYLGLHSRPDWEAQTLTNHTTSAKFRGAVNCERDVLQFRLTCKSINATYSDDRHTSGKLASVTLLFITETLYRGNVIGISDNLGMRYIRRQRQQNKGDDVAEQKQEASI
ncbi:beta-ketoacyl synthase N-terminal-like domain-containing protein [Xenorhabdus szentirmaii]|uniref:3-oxoacyl-(Acyl-carrier-protein) synthase n=1 Tax=Xenorhabdus szentirmaii DSM 16338 TaxID=1427518 RepID=W1IVL7_9GAMM|nr:beta-ketoacyl synthase N-terminal-like domain-containing protein [Xenorhabdus szentirmaii]PHM32992.1 phenolpthiocerol synthesis type-I polyketide synthase ppsB [Xenorhabdus szentirmaii DSM 16338]CDL82474.1 putative 3-oxoacyl-(acyl-carrier-protein) synthase [Xenorhabdus szentirmaii DSM 16338]